MNIIKQNGEFTKGEVFNMTQGTPDRVSDHRGEIAELNGWVLYEDVSSKGETQTVLAIRDKSGVVMATISEVFIKQFEKIVNFMGDEEYNIKIVGGTSKNGREYVTCEVA